MRCEHSYPVDTRLAHEDAILYRITAFSVYVFSFEPKVPLDYNIHSAEVVFCKICSDCMNMFFKHVKRFVWIFCLKDVRAQNLLHSHKNKKKKF